ncbi:phytoene desaturase family protein [Halosimplex aquaticum]
MGVERYDVGVVGGGVAGASAAARLQADGFSTVIFEQHDQIGGCAGYYRQDGFAFDVGATTLVDFGPGGVGGQFLDQIGFDPPPIDVQDAYALHLPDRTVTLYRDQERWRRERRATFGDDEAHRRFYQFLDDLSERLWALTRADVKLPVQNVGDLLRNLRAVGLADLGSCAIATGRWAMRSLTTDSPTTGRCGRPSASSSKTPSTRASSPRRCSTASSG